MVLRFSGARPEGTSMEVRCEKCHARYKVDDARIGPQGLTMRCGKCQNTFRVTRSSEQLAAPRPAAPAKLESSTMVFAAPSIAKPAAPAATRPPAAPLKPAAPRPGPAAASPSAVAPTEEGAGRTMMFQTGNLKTTPPGTKPMTAPTARPKPAAPEGEGGATMVFGQSPIAGAKSAAMPSKPAAARGAPGSAMMFGAGAGTAAAAKPAAAPARPATQRPFPASKPAPEAAESEASTDENDAQDGEEANVEAKADQHAERVSDEGSIHAKGAEERPAAEGAFDKAPPKGLLIGVMVGLAVLVLTGGGLVLWKKIAKHGPPPAAVETLATATSAALRDTMASLADAETKANDALDLAGPKSYFPQAVATLARIEIQWSDALNDQASFWTEKGQKAAEAGNDAKKTEAESKVAELQNQAKARLKIAFEKIAPAYKADPKSPDLELALADYYRAQRSNSNMNRELRKAQALKTEEPRIALVQGLAAAQEEDGAEKAISKLKTALNANANSARIHFRLAMAYLAAKDNDNAMKELKETLRISPQHERAKMAMEQLAAAPAEQK
jgi:predicted Zn finger-like uncharacterized protein